MSSRPDSTEGSLLTERELFVSRVEARLAELDEPAEMEKALVDALSHELDLTHCSYFRVIDGVPKERATWTASAAQAYPQRGELLDTATMFRLAHGESEFVEGSIPNASAGGTPARFFAAPALHRGDVRTVLLCLREGAQEWSTEEQALVRLVAVHARPIIERAELLRDLRAKDERAVWAERLYTTILSTVPDFVYVWDLQYRFLYANKALTQLYGVTGEEIIGLGFRDLGYPESLAEQHEREIDRVAATKQPVRGTVPFQSVGGGGIYDYIFVPVIGPSGHVEAVAGTTRDITDLTLAREALELTARRKNEFLTTLAHELRNPLAPLRNGVQLLRMADVTAKAKDRALEMMERQLKHMVHLIDDLMDLSRIDRGAIVLRQKALDIRQVVDVAVEISQAMIEQKTQKLRVISPAEPVRVWGDETRMVQVFSNVVHNAVLYTQAGGNIGVFIERNGQEVSVRVSDDGVGIESDELENVFDLFARGGGLQTSSGGGLGIGLHVVRRLVEMHGGRIIATSEGLGKGTTFQVILAAVQPDGEPLADSLPQSAPEKQRREGKLRILVVDDNEDSAETMMLLLLQLGHDAHAAFGGREALAVGEVLAPQIVLMDIGMPDMDGHATCREMRKTSWGSQARIVALTGWGKAEDQRRSREAGFDRHLVKPVSRANLLEVIEFGGPDGVQLPAPGRPTPEDPQ